MRKEAIMHDTLRNHKVKVMNGGGAPIVARKVRPNDPCPCGSGKKAKHCCGTETKYYATKKA